VVPRAVLLQTNHDGRHDCFRSRTRSRTTVRFKGARDLKSAERCRYKIFPSSASVASGQNPTQRDRLIQWRRRTGAPRASLQGREPAAQDRPRKGPHSTAGAPFTLGRNSPARKSELHYRMRQTPVRRRPRTSRDVTFPSTMRRPRAQRSGSNNCRRSHPRGKLARFMASLNARPIGIIYHFQFARFPLRRAPRSTIALSPVSDSFKSIWRYSTPDPRWLHPCRQHTPGRSARSARSKTENSTKIRTVFVDQSLKRGSFRNGSRPGLSFSNGAEMPAGIMSKCSTSLSASSFSPVHA